MTTKSKRPTTEHAELFALLHEATREYGIMTVMGDIEAAHRGSPRGFVNNENLHLLRRYRNGVSANAQKMMRDAGLELHSVAPGVVA